MMMDTLSGSWVLWGERAQALFSVEETGVIHGRSAVIKELSDSYELL